MLRPLMPTRALSRPTDARAVSLRTRWFSDADNKSETYNCRRCLLSAQGIAVASGA